MTERQVIEKKKMEGQPPTKRNRRLMEENLVSEDKEIYSPACLLELSIDNTVEKIRYNAKTMLSKHINDFEWHIVYFSIVGFVSDYYECPHPARSRCIRILDFSSNVLGNVADLLDEQLCNLCKDYCFSVLQTSKSNRDFKCLIGVPKDHVKMVDIFDDKRFSLRRSQKIPSDDYVHALLSFVKSYPHIEGIFVSPITGIQETILKLNKMIFNHRIAYDEHNLPDAKPPTLSVGAFMY